MHLHAEKATSYGVEPRPMLTSEHDFILRPWHCVNSWARRLLLPQPIKDIFTNETSLVLMKLVKKWEIVLMKSTEQSGVNSPFGMEV